MKLKDKFQRLFLYRYNYYVKMPISIFLNNNFKAYNVIVNSQDIYFYTNKIDKRFNEFEDVEIKNNYKKIFNFIFKTKYIMFFSIIIMFILFFTSNFFIREVVFENELEYNYNVYQDVLKHIKRIGPFMYIDDSLNDISYELKQKYYSYAYIGLERKASKIIIDIEYVDDFKKDEFLGNDEYSNIVAGADGKIVGIEVKKGLVVVSINQVVSKGDLLISGNINYLTNPSDKTNLVKSDGYVFIEYAKYINVEIPKTININRYTNKYSKYYNLYFFNNNIFKNKTKYMNNYIKKENIFKLSNILKIEKIYEYQKEFININLTKEEALDYSFNNIYLEFESKKVSKLEEIKFLKLIKEEENDNYYCFSYIMKCVENNIKTESI